MSRTRQQDRPGNAPMVRAGAAVVLRPALWGTAAREVVILAAPQWWRRWPPLPWPDPSYVRFRLQTAYGDAGQAPDPADLILWLRWCKAMRSMGRSAGG